MNAMTAHTDLAFHDETRVSKPQASRATLPGHSGPAAWLAAALRWFVEMPRRRAVINELLSLSDHELADIGLDRGDVVHLFDRSFAAGRRAA